MLFLILTWTWYYMLLESGGMCTNESCGYQPCALWKRLGANNLDRSKQKHLHSSIPLNMLGGANNTSPWPHTASLRLNLTGDTGKHTRDLRVGIQLAQEAPIHSEGPAGQTTISPMADW